MELELLPKEVAEALERGRHGISNYAFLKQVAGAVITEDLLIVHRWAFGEQGGTPDKLMNALVNGYEVEKTPEEKVREYYESIERWAKRMHESADHDGESNAIYELTGIKTTLNKLGIIIEGVNK